MIPESQPVRVTFLPMNVSIEASAGDTILDAALEHGIDLPHTCGGNCSCTTCQVLVLEGMHNLSPMQPPEDERLATASARTHDSRLACQALLKRGAVKVLICGQTEEWTDAESLAPNG